MKHIVLDIETIPPNPREFKAELKAIKPASNIKDPAKIKANLIQRRRAARKKAALLESAPIVCMGIKSEDWTVCFTSFEIEERKQLSDAGIFCFPSKTEEEMLNSASAFLSQVITPNTRLVTFNGKMFDLPKIRFRYAKHGLEIPKIFQPFWEHKDLMLEFTRYFCTNDNPFVSLSEVVRRLGIATGKETSGEYICDYLKSGQTARAVLHNVLDLILTEKVYFRICHEKDERS